MSVIIIYKFMPEGVNVWEDDSSLFGIQAAILLLFLLILPIPKIAVYPYFVRLLTKK